MNSFTAKVVADLDAGHPRPCGSCAAAVLDEGCDLTLALIVGGRGDISTAAFGLCPGCSPDAATARRHALAAILPVIPTGAKISTPGARP